MEEKINTTNIKKVSIILLLILVCGIVSMIISFEVSDDVWINRFNKSLIIDKEQSAVSFSGSTDVYRNDERIINFETSTLWHLNISEPYVIYKTIRTQLIPTDDYPKDEPIVMENQMEWKNGIFTLKQISDGVANAPVLEELSLDEFFNMLNFLHVFREDSFLDRNNFSKFAIDSTKRKINAIVKDDKTDDVFFATGAKNLNIEAQLDSNLNNRPVLEPQISVIELRY